LRSLILSETSNIRSIMGGRSKKLINLGLPRRSWWSEKRVDAGGATRLA